MSTIYIPNRRDARRDVQARYRRQARFWAALSDPETVLTVVGMGFVAGICLACLIGFLMPI